MNKVILMGRLTRDPELKYTKGAEPVAAALKNRANRKWILYHALLSANRASLSANIFIKDSL